MNDEYNQNTEIREYGTNNLMPQIVKKSSFYGHFPPVFL